MVASPALDLDSPFPLDPKTIETFRGQGFVYLKQVLRAEMLRHYRRETERLTVALNTQTPPLAERSTYDKAFLQVMNLWRESDLVRAFVFGKTLARIAAGLLEVDGVRLYHDQSRYKEPSNSITPARADQHHCPLASDRTVTAWIPLQPVPRDMGRSRSTRGAIARRSAATCRSRM